MLSMKLKFFFFITVNYEEDFMSSITKFPLLCIKYESSQQSQCYALLQTGTKTGSLRPKDNQIKSNHLKKKKRKKNDYYGRGFHKQQKITEAKILQENIHGGQ